MRSDAPAGLHRVRPRWYAVSGAVASLARPLRLGGAQALAVPQKTLLSPPAPHLRDRKCLVLDLDETLVHSSFKPVPEADFLVPVEIDGVVYQVYVSKRPHVDAFLKRCGELFEVVLFTASLAKYADPVTDLLDASKSIHARLFRESCVMYNGSYVKDLSLLGRNVKTTIIIDNSPVSYMFQPENAIPISSWFDDPEDTELLDLLPFLEDITRVENVCVVLDAQRVYLEQAGASS